MSEYGIKDKELEAHLNAISNGDFSKQLERAYWGNSDNYVSRAFGEDLYFINFGEMKTKTGTITQFSAFIRKDDITIGK